MFSVVILIGVSLLWGLAHSLSASLRFKNWLGARLDSNLTRWYRLVYNIIAVISFAPLVYLTLTLPDKALYTLPAFWGLVFNGIQLAALGLLAIGLLQTDVWSFAGLLPIFGKKEEEKERLVTKGLYAFVRHPLYTAGLLLLWFSPRMSVNQLTLYLALSVYIVVGAYFEERKLVRVFGLDYQNYKMRTPMLIPFIKKAPRD